MEEQRSGEDEAVDTVEDSPVTRQQRSGVLHTDVSFDRRHRDVTDETGQTDAETNGQPDRDGEGVRSGASAALKSGGGDTTHQPTDGLAGTDQWCHPAAADCLAPQELRDVVGLGEHHEEDEQAGGAGRSSCRLREGEQVGSVPDGENSQEDPEQNGSGGSGKAFGSAPDRKCGRNREGW